MLGKAVVKAFFLLLFVVLFCEHYLRLSFQTTMVIVVILMFSMVGTAGPRPGQQ